MTNARRRHLQDRRFNLLACLTVSIACLLAASARWWLSAEVVQALLIWLGVSVFVGCVVARFMAFGMGDERDAGDER